MAENCQQRLSANGTDQTLETKNDNNMELRAEIDTSPPFGSVKEAVTHFGGSGFWIPLHLLRDPHLGIEEFDINKVEEHAAKLEKDLTAKETETLDVLKELELTKRIIEELKLKLQQESSSSSQSVVTTGFDHEIRSSPPAIEKMDEKRMDSLSLCPTASSLGLILTELKQAKFNLSKTTNDLAVIRASVGSLNKKAEKQKTSVEMNRHKFPSKNPGGNWNSSADHHHQEADGQLTRVTKKVQVQQVPADDAETKKGFFQNPTIISRELEQLNFEAEQFIKMAEAAKFELLRAMPGFEQTKTSMRTAEMRWVAAKKMEEAARAVEAVALAEMKSLASSETSTRLSFQKPEQGITVSFEECSSLMTQNARKSDHALRSNKKAAALDAMIRIDHEANHVSKLAILRKLEEATEEVKHGKKALEDAFNRVEIANKRILATEEAIRRSWEPEQQYNSNKINAAETVKPVLRPTISVGDIISRRPPKQILPEDEEYVAIHRMERENEGRKVSLSQMLNRQRSSVVSSPTRSEKDVSSRSTTHDLKHFFAKNKKFGFIHLSIPLAKQSKMQASKLR